ncbi:ABC transporter substrate-binding protein [Magnetococcales bacterium HHB-1]
MSQSKPIRWVALGLSGIILVVLGVLFLKYNDKKEILSPLPEKIRVAAYHGDASALIWLAQEKGLFKHVGLNIDITPFSAGKLAADALSAGDVDLATCAEYVVVKKSFNEPNLRILGSIATATTNWIIGRKERGIASVKDLRGKKVGLTKGSTAEYFLGRVLTAYHMNFDDIELVDLAPPDIVESITRGDTDAAITWHPYVHHIQEQLGNNGISFDGQEGQNFYFILISNQTWLSQHPEHAERFMRALYRTERWLNENLQEGKTRIANLFNLDRALLEKVWSLQRLHLSFPQGLIVAMDAEKRWVIKKGIVRQENVPDFTHFIWPQPLEKVNRKSVTVIQ